MKPISSYSKFKFLLASLAGLTLGIVWLFYPIENWSGSDIQPVLKTDNNSPKTFIEDFKHNARRIGGEAFAVPKIEVTQITREPSINPSNFKTERQKNHVPVFSMPRPFVQDITTIISGSKTVKIANIAPLPAGSQCTEDGKTKPCGKIARTALRALIRGRTLTCRTVKKAYENDLLTTSCKIGNTDIANWLVKHGWTKTIGNN